MATRAAPRSTARGPTPKPVPAKPATPGPLALLLRDAAVFVCALVAVYLLIALSSYDPRDAGWSTTGSAEAHNLAGTIGAWLADFALSVFGYMAYPLPLLLMVWAGRWAQSLHRRPQPMPRGAAAAVPGSALAPWVRGLGGVLFVAAGAVFCQLLLEPTLRLLPGAAGGILGALATQLLLPWIGALVTLGFSLALALAGLTLATGLSWFKVFDQVGAWTLLGIGLLRRAGSGLGLVLADLRDWLTRTLKTRAARRAENRKRAESVVRAQERPAAPSAERSPSVAAAPPANASPVAKPVPLRPVPTPKAAPAPTVQPEHPPVAPASPPLAPAPTTAPRSAPTLIEPVFRMPEPEPDLDLEPEPVFQVPQRREPTLPPRSALPDAPANAVAPPPPAPPPAAPPTPTIRLPDAYSAPRPTPAAPAPGTPETPPPVLTVVSNPAPLPAAAPVPPPTLTVVPNPAPRPLPLSDAPPIAPGPQPIQPSERAVREAQALPPAE
ncbi:MAG: DNA translocase FtsK 4TM domain-containing protein, partial [Xanthomonadales bacterium]|nr:DNA translocase FtsK 4TM domain-containing protein [Xanthomonadales bacterium]